MRTFTDCVIAVTKYEHDLTFRQVAVLAECARTVPEEDRQIHSLATLFSFSRPVISRAADKLEEIGYVERSSLAHDRRTCVLSVTKKGHRFLLDVQGQPVPAVESKSRKRRAEARVAA